MMQMTARKNFNLNNIKLDLHRELNTGIRIICGDISQGIYKGSQFGKAFKFNAESTVRRKGFNMPLYDKGVLSDVSKMITTEATATHQVAKLLPHESRIDISFYHNTGDGNPKREHWGISEKAEKKILQTMEAKITKEIRNA